MEIVKPIESNNEDEHMCCAISDKKFSVGYEKKKDRIKTEIKTGYTFKKLNVRGKVFIEYVSIEHSWWPINGKNFMVINCFLVSGQFKGKGNGSKLLEQRIADSKDMEGIIAILSDRKRSFMTDPKFLKYKGIEVIEEAPPYLKLWGVKIYKEAGSPQIKKSAKSGTCPDKEGITAYYSDTYPFTDYYTNQRLRGYTNEKVLPLTIKHTGSQGEGHKMPNPWVINSVFYKGEFVTLEMK